MIKNFVVCFIIMLFVFYCGQILFNYVLLLIDIFTWVIFIFVTVVVCLL